MNMLSEEYIEDREGPKYHSFNKNSAGYILYSKPSGTYSMRQKLHKMHYHPGGPYAISTALHLTDINTQELKKILPIYSEMYIFITVKCHWQELEAITSQTPYVNGVYSEENYRHMLRRDNQLTELSDAEIEHRYGRYVLSPLFWNRKIGKGDKI